MREWWLRQPGWLIGAVIGGAAFALVAVLANLDGGESATLAPTSTTHTSLSSSTSLGSPVAPDTTTTSSIQPPQPTTTTGPPASTTRPSTTVATTTTSQGPGSETATLTSTTDGDTIDVHIVGGGLDTVRLIGINSPEVGECFAAEATQALDSALAAQTFQMTSDVSDRDQFDRLLRYLWLSDGTFVNEDLVRGGFALAREFPPDTAHADRLAAAQAEAQQAARGLWAPGACGPPSASSIEIVHVEYDAPGNDNENLNGEWVDIANVGDSAQLLIGWVLKDESASHRYHFPGGFSLGSSAGVRVHTGCGTDTPTTLYWCSGGAVWNNDGDTAFLLDDHGNITDHYAY